MIQQKELVLPAMAKGFHLINQLILNVLENLPETGLLNLFLKHTSAALMLNENADSDVRIDLKTLYDKLAPEEASFYAHTIEGRDDMPAHFKTALTGNSITIPITNHHLNIGIWQGIFLCEFRKHGGNRKLVITVYY